MSKKHPTESHMKSWLKAVSWRIFGTLTTFGVTYAMTKSINLSTSITAIEFFAKVFLFYIHERLWVKVGWLLSTYSPNRGT